MKGNLLKSISHARDGLVLALKTQRNFVIEVVIGILALVASILLQVNILEFLFVLSAIFFVLVTEILNSSIEHLSDVASQKKYHEVIKTTKDLSAAAVLLSTYYALAVGGVVILGGFLKLIMG